MHCIACAANSALSDSRVSVSIPSSDCGDFNLVGWALRRRLTSLINCSRGRTDNIGKTEECSFSRRVLQLFLSKFQVIQTVKLKIQLSRTYRSNIALK